MNDENKKKEIDEAAAEAEQAAMETQTVPPIHFTASKEVFACPDVIVNRYEVIEVLGVGNMGTVWRCKDLVGNLEVAIKSVSPGSVGDDAVMQLFYENFRVVQKLNHPAIGNAKSLELDEETGVYFLVMEYVEGETLAKRIGEHEDGMPIEEIIPIVRSIAEGLDYSHGKNTVHRDVKPSNIIIERESGAAKLLDFGIAGEFSSTLIQPPVKKPKDRTNQSGTPFFMAPEQWLGYRQDGRTDQYGLAATVYTLLSGRPPFGFLGTLDEVRDCTLNVAVEPLAEVNAEVWEVLEKALAKTKSERFDTCIEFVDALASAAGITPPVSGAAVADSPAGKRGGAMWWTALVGVLSICTAMYFLKYSDPEPSQGFTVSENLKYHALVIGIDKYPEGWAALRNAVNDARAVAATLEETYGFNVTMLLDEQATEKRILAELDRISDKTIEDMVLIYFAGHGQVSEQTGEGYWIPVDGLSSGDGKDGTASWILNAVVSGEIESSSARHVLVVSDACYADFLPSEKSEGAGTLSDSQYRDLLNRSSRYVLASGGNEPVYDEGGKGHSPFAWYFLDYLKGNQQAVFSIAELYDAIRPKYQQLTSKSMMLAPLLRDTGGQFVFIRNDTPRNGVLSALGKSVHPAEQLSAHPYERVNLLAYRGRTNAVNRLVGKLEREGVSSEMARWIAQHSSVGLEQQAMEQTRQLIKDLKVQEQQEDPELQRKRKAYAEPRSVALIPFEVRGKSGARAYNLAQTLHRGMTVALGEEGVRVVNREILNNLLSEVALQRSDIADNRARSFEGKLLPASAYLTGYLSPGKEGDRLMLEWVDVATSQSLHSFEVLVTAEEDLAEQLGEVAQQLVDALKTAKPLQAKVVKQDGAYRIFAGSFHGLSESTPLMIETRAPIRVPDAAFEEWRIQSNGVAQVKVLGETISDVEIDWGTHTTPADAEFLWAREIP